MADPLSCGIEWADGNNHWNKSHHHVYNFKCVRHGELIFHIDCWKLFPSRGRRKEELMSKGNKYVAHKSGDMSLDPYKYRKQYNDSIRNKKWLWNLRVFWPRKWRAVRCNLHMCDTRVIAWRDLVFDICCEIFLLFSILEDEGHLTKALRSWLNDLGLAEAKSAGCNTECHYISL